MVGRRCLSIQLKDEDGWRELPNRAMQQPNATQPARRPARGTRRRTLTGDLRRSLLNARSLARANEQRTLRNFSKRVSERLDSDLLARGFVYDSQAYRRVSSTGLVHGVCFDNRGRDSQHFLVMVFVNALEVDGQINGGHLVRYFTGGSLSELPRDLACGTEEQLMSALDRLRKHFDAIVEPFFASISSCSALAASLAKDPRLDFYRAHLYALEGNRTATRAESSMYLERVARSLGPSHPALAEAQAFVTTLLSRCGESEEPG